MGSLPEQGGTTTTADQQPDPGSLRELYRRLVLVRSFDEHLVALTRQGKVKGPMHVGTGQEAVGVGATAALGQADLICATHRAHAYYIGRGLDLYGLVAEMTGRADGLCKGRAGHMLVADVARGMLGGSAIVGQSLLMGVGHGLALKYRKVDGICLVSTGDGAVNSGAFNEALNMIALWELPVVVLVENNGYGLTVRLERHVKNGRLYERAAGYGLTGSRVDGNDVLAVRQAVTDARTEALAGRPSLIEAMTYRATGFSTSDIGGYQDVDVERGGFSDCIATAEERLQHDGLNADELAAVRADAVAEIEAAIARAADAPMASELSAGQYF